MLWRITGYTRSVRPSMRLKQEEYEIHPIDYDLLDEFADPDEDDDSSRSVWTWQRLALALIALLILLSLLAYEIAPLIDMWLNPPPTPDLPPIFEPRDRV
ncbi:MAG: hypothetical protein JNM70_06585 [Anaerolineae bacterium]|nr:hypothetical protein [Anaerolineae bacterium]